jgi:hypothetical protein
MNSAINLINSNNLTSEEKHIIKSWNNINFKILNQLKTLDEQRNNFKNQIYNRINLLLSYNLEKIKKDKILNIKNNVSELNTYPDFNFNQWKILTDEINSIT